MFAIFKATGMPDIENICENRELFRFVELNLYLFCRCSLVFINVSELLPDYMVSSQKHRSKNIGKYANFNEQYSHSHLNTGRIIRII